jgi:hypothetical protein
MEGEKGRGGGRLRSSTDLYYIALLVHSPNPN